MRTSGTLASVLVMMKSTGASLEMLLEKRIPIGCVFV